jgi:hypothetical protein
LESTWEYSGNVEIGPGFPEVQDRIQFAANLSVKVSRRSNPCFSHDHVFASSLA